MHDPIVGLPPDLVRHPDISFAFAEETWHLPRAIFRKVRQKTNGRGVKVAVLDTGFYKHVALKEPITTRSFIPGESIEDLNGHGTHCSGTVCAQDEDIGVAPGADLIIGKVLSNRGSGSSSGIAAGVRWAIEQGADVISLSLGGSSRYEPTIDAIKLALSRGIIVCCAAGNAGFNGQHNTIGYPARAGESVCVAALNSSWVPANFSSGGIQMTVAAPGQQILSCNNGAGFVFMSGTSMATPFVAGCFALFLSNMRMRGLPSITGIEAVNRFVSDNATDLLSPGHDSATGHGMFNVLEIVTKLAKDEVIYG